MRERGASSQATHVPANVAQLVEQLTRNEQVTGSSPVVGSTENGPEKGRKSRIQGVYCFKVELVEQSVEPRQALAPAVHVALCSGSGCLFEPVEVAQLLAGAYMEQVIEEVGLVLSERGLHLVVESNVNPLAHRTDEAVEYAEGRQFVAASDEFFDHHVDEVGRITHRVGGFSSGGPGDLFAALTPGGDAEVGAQHLVVVVPGALGIVDWRRVRWQFELPPQVHDDRIRYLVVISQ